MDNQPEEIVLRISAKKEAGYAKKVAGAIGWRLREEGYCKARAVKQDAVSTATKALAICNQRVSEAGISFYMELCFSKAENEDGKVATAIEMTIQEMDYKKPDEFKEYKVSGKQDENNSIMSLAEALAVPVRNGNGVNMKCIGPASVYKGIMAATIARGLIYPNGLEAIVVPKWDSIEEEGKPPVSLINLEFWGNKIQDDKK
jgi:stage V sporulation protein SpoVS